MPFLTCRSYTQVSSKKPIDPDNSLIPGCSRTELYVPSFTKQPFSLWFWFLVLSFISPWRPEPSFEYEVDCWRTWLTLLFLPAPFTRAGVFSYSAKYTWTAVIACFQTQVRKPSKTESTCSGLFLVLSGGLIFLASKPAVAFSFLLSKSPAPH